MAPTVVQVTPVRGSDPPVSRAEGARRRSSLLGSARRSSVGTQLERKDLELQKRVRQYDDAVHDANLSAAFAVIDTDRSGCITVHELGVFARAEGYVVSDAQLEVIFAQVDEDGDHSTLTFVEFVAVMDEVEAGACMATALQGFMGSIMELQEDSRPLYEQMAEANAANAGSHAEWRIALGEWIDGTGVQLVVLMLIVLDMLAVACELVLSATACAPLPAAELSTPGSVGALSWGAGLTASNRTAAAAALAAREQRYGACSTRQHDWEGVIGKISKSILFVFAAQVKPLLRA